MAAVTGAAIASAGAAAYGAHQQGKAGETAARGARDAAALSQAQYEQTRRDLQPYMQTGERSLSTLNALNRGDYSSFTESPDYQFTRDQGIKALDRSAASRGTQYSGGQLAALAGYAGGVANQGYSDYYNRIAQLAGMGQNSAVGAGNAGMAYAGQAGNAIQSAANARAATQWGQASTYGNLGEQLSGAFGRWYEGRGSGGSGDSGINPISNTEWQSAYNNIPPVDQYAWRRG